MTITKGREAVHVVFPPEATLATVQDDTEAIDRVLQEAEEKADVELDCRGIEEIDSCYLQLVLMTVFTRKTKEVWLMTGRDNRIMKEMLKLYGIADGRLHWVEDQDRLRA